MVVIADPVSHAVDRASREGSENGTTKNPYLVFCAAPFDGHARPVLRIAGELLKRDFEASFISGKEWEEKAKAMGLEHYVSIPSGLPPEMQASLQVQPPELSKQCDDMGAIFLSRMKHNYQAISKLFLDKMKHNYRVLIELLEQIHERDPKRPIIILNDSTYMGVLPLMLGAPLPKGFTVRPKTIHLRVASYSATSVDTGPYGAALPPDSSESGRARNKLLENLMLQGPWAPVVERQTQVLQELGVTDPPTDTPQDTWYLKHDAVVQMCPPSLEYPRSDVAAHVKFAGCISPQRHPQPLAADFMYPHWWEEVTNREKKVVMVTQGTVITNPHDLVIPVTEALAAREDLLVVIILGKRGAKLPESVIIPSNTRVIDYLSYDALLPYAFVFVMNGGYGGAMQGVAHGVPMVIAGAVLDKAEVAMRAAWAGVAVNLGVGSPSVERVRGAVERVLTDPRFHRRAEEIRRENEALDLIGYIEEKIIEFAK
jgi:UDP:flavonoid glycosyltransferase YjiC (YdhE family)